MSVKNITKKQYSTKDTRQHTASKLEPLIKKKKKKSSRHYDVYIII